MYGPQLLLCVNALPIGSGTIRRSDRVGIGVDLLKKVCHHESEL